MDKKKILLIMPFFYEYHVILKSAIEKRGYNVTLYNDSPSYFIWRLFYFFSKKGFNINRIENCYSNYIKKRLEQNGLFDYFILIKGEAITIDFINQIKRTKITKTGACIYYTWDSLFTFKKSNDFFQLFDRAFTFDPYDYEFIYEKKINFLPLFFLDKYRDSSFSYKNNIKYDICIIGSYQKERYKMVKELSQIKNMSLLAHIYIPLVGYVKQRFVGGIEKPDKDIIKFHKIKIAEIRRIYRQAKAILDIPNVNQTGLSVRVLDCLALKKKLITTSQNIKKYDFFNPANIYILDIENPVYPDRSWLDSPYEEVGEDIVVKYSIDSWLDSLLG